MTHPLHPDHPRYAEMVAAGRAPAGDTEISEAIAVLVQTIVDPMRCYSLWYPRSGEAYCGRPVVATVAREDSRGVIRGVCAEHGRSFMAATFERFVVTWLYACSCCDQPALHYQLDSSGRCDRCRP